jgi:hypothetical protein
VAGGSGRRADVVVVGGGGGGWCVRSRTLGLVVSCGSRRKTAKVG